jgi:hypothetical protein
MKLFTLYVGLEKDASGEPIHSEAVQDWLKATKEKLADEFGGYSLGEVAGGYRHMDGQLAEERALRIEVTASEEQQPRVRSFAAWARDTFRQESVLLNATTIESAFV